MRVMERAAVLLSTEEWIQHAVAQYGKVFDAATCNAIHALQRDEAFDAAASFTLEALVTTQQLDQSTRRQALQLLHRGGFGRSTDYAADLLSVEPPN